MVFYQQWWHSLTDGVLPAVVAFLTDGVLPAAVALTDRYVDHRRRHGGASQLHHPLVNGGAASMCHRPWYTR